MMLEISSMVLKSHFSRSPPKPYRLGVVPHHARDELAHLLWIDGCLRGAATSCVMSSKNAMSMRAVAKNGFVLKGHVADQLRALLGRVAIDCGCAQHALVKYVAVFWTNCITSSE